MNPLSSTTLPSIFATCGIIFDFDGVIVDSLPAHIKAWEMAAFNLFAKNLVQSQRFIGLSTHSIANLITSELGNKSKSRQLVSEKNRILLHDEVEVPLLPGIESLLQELISLEIPYGLASNAPRDFIEQQLENHSLEFKIIFGRGEGGRNKPHPDVFLRCAKELKLTIIDQRNTLIFEDSKHGLTAAKRANMVPVGICTQHSSEELLDSGARLTYKDLADFMKHTKLTKLPSTH